MTPVPVSRRRFLAAVAGGAVLLAAGCARDKVRSATLVDFLGDDRRPGDPLWSPEAKAYVAAYPSEYLPKAKQLYNGDQYASVALGLVALSMSCTNDAVQVAYCGRHQVFVCPACRSIYTGVGEVRGGPAPRALDRYWVAKDEDGGLVIDRGRKIRGPAREVTSVPFDAELAVDECLGVDLRTPSGSSGNTA